MAKGRKPAVGHKTGHAKTKKAPTSQGLAKVDEGLATIEPPDDLPPVAAEAWRVCTREMAANRHFREPDLYILHAYVSAIQGHADALASILEHGSLMRHEKKDEETGAVEVRIEVNPAVKMRNDAANQMRYLSDILGLNPQARIRQQLAEIAGGSMLLDIRERLVHDISRGR